MPNKVSQGRHTSVTLARLWSRGNRGGAQGRLKLLGNGHEGDPVLVEDLHGSESTRAGACLGDRHRPAFSSTEMKAAALRVGRATSRVNRIVGALCVGREFGGVLGPGQEVRVPPSRGRLSFAGTVPGSLDTENPRKDAFSRTHQPPPPSIKQPVRFPRPKTRSLIGQRHFPE